MKRWTVIIAVMLTIALLTGCADAGAYVKDHYPLVSAQGQGNQVMKVYSADGKSVPEVASEIASQDKPREKSKESQDQMFLVYDDKIINIQKDPEHTANSLVEIDSIAYAKQHYDSSFLQGYLTASLLQSLFGGSWYNSAHSNSGYRGYSSVPPSQRSTYDTSPGIDSNKPSTTQGSGSFSTGKNGSSGIRKDDGSVPKVSNGAGSSWGTNSRPSTGTRSGSFKRK